MKPITKKAFIRAPTYIWAFMVLLVLSSMIGATVWAKKPSPPEPEIVNYNISIGGEITLTGSLLVENVIEGGYWLPPPTKGKGKAQQDRFWGITLLGEEGDDCGTYTIAPVPGGPGYEDVILSDILPKADAYFFSIEHTHTRVPHEGERDYWDIGIAWLVGTFGSDLHFIGIMGRTNIDAEWEGEYNEDTWIVTFDNSAEFGVIENTESGDIEPRWEGALSFTVEITRTLVQP